MEAIVYQQKSLSRFDVNKGPEIQGTFFAKTYPVTRVLDGMGTSKRDDHGASPANYSAYVLQGFGSADPRSIRKYPGNVRKQALWLERLPIETNMEPRKSSPAPGTFRI